MCNPRPAGRTLARRIVWCSPPGFVHDLEMVFQINYIPNKNSNIFDDLGTIDHETNINIRAICDCYATAQIKLFVV